VDIPRAARECIEETASLIGRFGSRLAGGEAARDTAATLAGELGGFCDSVALESFEVHPGSFYSYTKILPACYALGAMALFLPRGLSILPALGLLAGMAIMVCQFDRYLHFPDFLFPKRVGWNVGAVLESALPPERELLLSGHHDSAPLARIFSSPFAKCYAAAIFLPYAFFLFELGLLVARLSGSGFAGAGAASAPWTFIALAAGCPFVLGYFLLVDTRKGGPGAGDNLVSSVMVARIARELAADRGAWLKTTRLRVLSFDAEEAGLRGSSAWFRAHAAELKGIPCVHLNFDSLYSLADLQVLLSDVNGHQRLDEGMAAELIRCAAAEGYAMKGFSMLFGGGATDAAEGARAGIRAGTIIAMPTAIVRDDLVYHTPRDTADRIEPEVVEACIRIALRYLASAEAESGPGGVARPR
jgi:aminopeptidase YwaD